VEGGKINRRGNNRCKAPCSVGRQQALRHSKTKKGKATNRDPADAQKKKRGIFCLKGDTNGTTWGLKELKACMGGTGGFRGGILIQTK